MKYINRKKLSFIRLDLTDKCNLNCVGCYRSKIWRKELPTQKIIEIIDKIKDFGVDTIILGGGEPFFRKDIKKIITHLKEKSINCYIVTNGTLINDVDVNFLKKYSPNLSISLDGYNELTNSQSRSPYSFKSVIKTLNLFKENQVKFNLVTTLSKINVNNLEKIITQGKNIGAKEHHFIRFIPIGKGKSLQRRYLSDSEWKVVLERLKKDKRLVFDEKYITGDCGAGTEFLCILVNGDITICTRKSQEIILGNIFKKNLEDILDESKFLKKMQNLKKADCLNCHLPKN